MCGIAGIALSAPDARLRARLDAMAGAMRHRGPDDGGYFVADDGRSGLANRRLAIRDLSPAGHMPMGDEAGALWITYNGELYNADDLRPELERLGYRFRSQSDTEVILHGYAAWGEGVVERLRGMFAFAIHDGRPGHRRLFLARDRLGIKPLYYSAAPGRFLFASELRTLLASDLVSRERDPAAVVAFLRFGSVPAPLTIYRDAVALEPGHTLTVPLDGAPVPTARRYWALPTDERDSVTAGEALEEVRALLAEVVRIRLVSDVPLGAFLSGGLDSSAVVALMRRATDGPIRTCSMTFEEAAYSEGPYARAMAEHVGAEHFERVITAAEVTGALPRILAAMDQPTIDGLNTYFVSETARQAGLTVALSGLGGDELFGGYPNTFGQVPRVAGALRLAHALPGGAVLARAALGALPRPEPWRRLRDALREPPSLASAYLTRRGLFAPSEVQALVSPEIWREAAQSLDLVDHVARRADSENRKSRLRHASEIENRKSFAWISRAELATYTHHQLLRDTDAMSMAHSLEVRVPLLDHKLVEAVLRLPAALKTNGGTPKPLLAAAVADLLPPVVRDRRDKMGFTFPLALWLRGPLGGDYRAMTAPGLRPDTVAETWRRFDDGHVHWSRPWALAVLGAFDEN